MATVPAPPSASAPVDGGPLLQLRAGSCCDGHGDDVGYVELSGVLDVFAASHIREPLAGFADFAGDLVIDTGPLHFIDSAGLRLLEDVCDRAASHGNIVWLHDPGRVIARLRRLIGVDEMNGTCAPGQTAAAAIVSPRRWFRSRAVPRQPGTRRG